MSDDGNGPSIPSDLALQLAAYMRKHPGPKGAVRYRIENLSGCQDSEAALDRLVEEVETLLRERPA